MAIKPFVGAVREPSTWKEEMIDSQAPTVDLELAHVYGYRSQDVRSNLHYTNSKSEFVYHAASIGIVYDPQTRKQRFSQAHQDDIISLAVHGNLVATGEIGKSPAILLWDSISGNTLKTLKGFHSRGVSLLAFSPSGCYLASIGSDESNSLAIYNLEKETLVAKDKVEKARTFDIAFGGADDELVIVGMGFVKFFSFSETTGQLKSKKGILQKTKDPVLSVTFLKSDVITGHGDGTITSWKGRTQNLRKTDVHRKAINTLHVCKEGVAAFVSGGADGLVVLWNAAIDPIKKFDMTQLAKAPMSAEVRSISMMQNYLLIGTKSSEIIELNTATGDSQM